MRFTEIEQYILIAVAKQVDEVHVEFRKGVSQSKYIMKLNKDQTWYNHETRKEEKIISSLAGYWMMKYPSSLQYTTLEDCIKDFEWVRCKAQKVTVTKWIEITKLN